MLVVPAILIIVYVSVPSPILELLQQLLRQPSSTHLLHNVSLRVPVTVLEPRLPLPVNLFFKLLLMVPGFVPAQQGRYVDAHELEQRIVWPLRLVILNADFAEVDYDHRRPTAETFADTRIMAHVADTGARSMRFLERYLAMSVRVVIRRRGGQLRHWHRVRLSRFGARR